MDATCVDESLEALDTVDSAIVARNLAVLEPLLPEKVPPRPHAAHVHWSASVSEDALEEVAPSAMENGNVDSDMTFSNGLDNFLESKEKKVNVDGYPSSRNTVLVTVGFFLTGLMFLLSGFIVVTVERHVPFQIVGSAFIVFGAATICFCIWMQQKNVKKMSHNLKHDFYVLFAGNVIKND